MARILCIGIAVIDYVFALAELPRPGEKNFTDTMAIVGGGIAANAAVAVRRLGGEAMLATRLGDDLIAEETISGLAAEGVDCRLAVKHAGCRSSLSAVAVDRRGERMLFNFKDSKLPALPDWLPATLPAGVDGVLADTRWEAGATHMLTLARAAGRPAMLDVDRKPADPALLAAATHLAFSQRALHETTGIADAGAAFRAYAATSAQWLAVTDGARGCWYREAGTESPIVHVPAFKVMAVDTLGAGDTWHGAVILALAEGCDTAAAIRFGRAAAALKCTRFGGRAGIPTRAEVDHFLTMAPEDRP
jgi:sulfofructose kinase